MEGTSRSQLWFGYLATGRGCSYEGTVMRWFSSWHMMSSRSTTYRFWMFNDVGICWYMHDLAGLIDWLIDWLIEDEQACIQSDYTQMSLTSSNGFTMKGVSGMSLKAASKMILDFLTSLGMWVTSALVAEVAKLPKLAGGSHACATKVAYAFQNWEKPQWPT